MNTGVIFIILIVILLLYFSSRCNENYTKAQQGLDFDYRYYAMHNPEIFKTYSKLNFSGNLPEVLPETCLPNPFPEELRQNLYDHWKYHGHGKKHRFCSSPCKDPYLPVMVTPEECSFIK